MLKANLYFFIGFYVSVAFRYTSKEYFSIADLHGDLNAAHEALLLTRLVDEKLDWIGGDRILVQTGDIVDRGAESKEIYDLFRKLRQQAESSGGHVVQILGNHEVMNLQGNYFYVDRREYSHWSQTGDIQEGQILREKAWKIDGDYGSWLRKLPLAAVVNRTLFCHAGIDVAWANQGLDKVNELSAELLTKEDNSVTDTIFLEAGPVWTRAFDPVYSRTSEKIMCEKLFKVLSTLDLDRMVIGHNVQLDNTAKTFCDGRLFSLDVGMSAYYGGGRSVFHHGPNGVEIITKNGSIKQPMRVTKKVKE